MDSKSEIILYQPDNEVRLEVRLEDETVWLTHHASANGRVVPNFKEQYYDSHQQYF